MHSSFIKMIVYNSYDVFLHRYLRSTFFTPGGRVSLLTRLSTDHLLPIWLQCKGKSIGNWKWTCSAVYSEKRIYHSINSLYEMKFSWPHGKQVIYFLKVLVYHTNQKRLQPSHKIVVETLWKPSVGNAVPCMEKDTSVSHDPVAEIWKNDPV